MSKKLVVNGDDFDMCHSVNVGIVECFTNGVLTQASLMASCPWFEEAIALAKEHGIPVGVHLTVTCDWDMYRWRPLTSSRSLMREDGCYYSTIEEVKERADPAELKAELSAQIELVRSRGFDPVFLESHVGIADEGIVAELCRMYGLLFRDPADPLHEPYQDCMVRYDSYCKEYLAGMSTQEKIGETQKYIRGLSDGVHSLSGNPAVASSEMESVCSDAASERKKNWAQPFRVSFLELFTSPGIIQVCRDCEVELVPLEGVI